MKFLIVGLGSMGKRRTRNLQHLRAGEIIGFDPRPDRREEAAAKHGIRTFADFGEAMSAGPDALIISTPPDRHLEYALAAARAGKHFFTEAGVTDEGLDELEALCAGRPIVAAPSCTLRFNPSIRRLKELVDGGAIGRVLTFTYHCGQYLPDWHPWEDYRTFYVARRATGACREIVPFELVWLTWLFGDVERVSGMRDKLTRLETDIDDAYHLLLRFRSGQLGHLLVDVISRVPYRSLRLLSEDGVITWEWAEKTVRVYRADRKEWREYKEPPGMRVEGYVAEDDMYVEEMRAFVAAVRGEAPWPYTLADDRRVLGLLQAAERSSDEGVHVRV